MTRIHGSIAVFITCAGGGLAACSSGAPDSVREPVATQGAASSGDALGVYAAMCDDAMGSPGGRLGPLGASFDCLDPVKSFPLDIKVDGGVVSTPPAACDDPTLLDDTCAVGQRLVVLGADATSRAIAICRKLVPKVGKPDSGGYNEIDLFQFNSQTGATCFYGTSFVPGRPANAITSSVVPNPAQGLGTMPGTSATYWQAPSSVAAGKCVQCHDSGALIRSPAVMTAASHIPAGRFGIADPLGVQDPATNNTTPYRFVGHDMASSWRTWSVQSSLTAGKNYDCGSCHRLGVSNVDAKLGTSTGLGPLSVGCRTGEAGCTPDSAVPSTMLPFGPHWMIPGVGTSFDPTKVSTAASYAACAAAITSSSALPAGCSSSDVSTFNPAKHLPGISLWLDDTVDLFGDSTYALWYDPVSGDYAYAPFTPGPGTGLPAGAGIPQLGSNAHGAYMRFAGPRSGVTCDALTLPDSTPLAFGTGDFALAVVASAASSTSAGVLLKATDAGFNGPLLMMNDSSTGSFDASLAPREVITQTNTFRFGIYGVPITYTPSFGDSPHVPGQNPHIFVLRRTTNLTGQTTVETRVDGQPTSTSITESPATNLPNGLATLMGCDLDGTAGLVGEIFEVVAAKAHVGDWDIHALEVYLHDKHKLAGTLPL